MVRSIVSTLCAALVGAAAALLAQSFRGSASDTPEAPTESPTNGTPARVHTRTVVAQLDDARLSLLERRLNELSDERESAAEEAESEVLPDAEQEVQHLRQLSKQQEEHFEKDAVDPAWSPAASQQLRSALDRVASQRGFKLVAAEC